MENTTSFGEVLEAVERLSPDEQETLLVIVRHRLAEQGRKRLAQDIREAREKFAEGRCKPTKADDLAHEILVVKTHTDRAAPYTLKRSTGCGTINP